MPKYKQVKINLNQSDYDQIKKICISENISMTEYFRKSIGKEIDNPREPKQIRIHKKTDPKLLYQLNKIGNNINQIAKHLNTKKASNINVAILTSLVNVEKSLKDLL